MIQFILNEKLITTDLPGGTILLDFIRKEEYLSGTKVGCREGDCGACTVLQGHINNDNIIYYQTITSCLTPLVNVNGKHIVTIEGLNLKNKLNGVQQSMKKYNATQCGFCTPGFVVAFTSYALNKETSIKCIRESISGNICRCTGYKSIEKAALDIFEQIKRTPNGRNLDGLIKYDFIPGYFREIPERLQKILPLKVKKTNILIGGGTDLYVQKADILQENDLSPIQVIDELHKVDQDDFTITIGAGLTPSDLLNNEPVMSAFPKFRNFFTLISSQVIRNMGTLGGNFVNASPIGDLSIIFLALNTELNLRNYITEESRKVPLKDFFLDYKKTALQPDELIESLTIDTHPKRLLNFEKVSKRNYLDIASVNSAMSIQLRGNVITEIHLSAGGVAHIPRNLKNTSAFLKGKELSTENIRKAHCVLKEEIAPISDIRGSTEYKRLLLRQLYYCHFTRLFPDKIDPLALFNPS